MPRTILIIDVSHLCYRALYSTADLSHDGVRTGVVYGTLREIMELRITFNADITAFCFDSQHSKRKEIFPEYKSNRRKATEITNNGEPTVPLTEEEKAWLEMHRQMLALRLKYLSWAGFKNLMIKQGYEADDLAASIVQNSIKDDDTVFLVTGDKDYYQLLRHNVIMYDSIHRKRTTLQSFTKEHKFTPDKWPEYQSICGCSTDTVPGIPGVGPVNAALYCRIGGDKMPARMHLAIDSRKGREIRARNLKLVKLPFEGCPKFELKPDTFDLKGWRKVCDELGAATLKKYL